MKNGLDYLFTKLSFNLLHAQFVYMLCYFILWIAKNCNSSIPCETFSLQCSLVGIRLFPLVTCINSSGETIRRHLHQTCMLVKKDNCPSCFCSNFSTQIYSLFLFFYIFPLLKRKTNKKTETGLKGFITLNEFLISSSKEFSYEFWWKLSYFCKPAIVLNNTE